MSNPDCEARAHALIHSAILPSERHGPLWGEERLWEVLKLGEGERSTQPVTWEAIRVTMMWLQPKDSDSNQDSSYLSTWLEKQGLNSNQGAEGKRWMKERTKEEDPLPHFRNIMSA